MSRYYFHTADLAHARDTSGVDLPDDAAAHLTAIRFAGEVLAQNPEKLLKTGHWRVDVTNAADKPLFTIIAANVCSSPPG